MPLGNSKVDLSDLRRSVAKQRLRAPVLCIPPRRGPLAEQWVMKLWWEKPCDLVNRTRHSRVFEERGSPNIASRPSLPASRGALLDLHGPRESYLRFVAKPVEQSLR